MDFKERLVELRKDKELSQRQLSKQTGISISTIEKWEMGNREPNAHTLKILAKFFNVTAGYLLGLEN